MPQSIKDFLARKDIKEIKEGHTQGEVMSEDFFRDPFRSIHLNHDLFYAPADGVVLYCKERVKPMDFLDIKGKDYGLTELLADPDYKEESLVIGIFMTWLSVHVNRVPVSCYYLDMRETNPIVTHGISMLEVENDLLEDLKPHYDADDLEYLVHNEKNVSTFYCPAIKSRFYIVQVADKQVDAILNWDKGKHITQGDRFGQIRQGSQCDIVIPLKKGIDLEILARPLQYVEAGVDPILRVTRKEAKRK